MDAYYSNSGGAPQYAPPPMPMFGEQPPAAQQQQPTGGLYQPPSTMPAYPQPPAPYQPQQQPNYAPAPQPQASVQQQQYGFQYQNQQPQESYPQPPQPSSYPQPPQPSGYPQPPQPSSYPQPPQPSSYPQPPQPSGYPQSYQQPSQQQQPPQPRDNSAIPPLQPTPYTVSTTPVQSGSPNMNYPSTPPTVPTNNGSFGRAPTTPLTQQQGAARSQQVTPNAEQGQRARPIVANTRINSSKIPSPCRDLPPDTAGSNRPRFITSTAGNPPLSVTRFIATDDGNASPKFLRPTMHVVPHDPAFVREGHVTLGAVISPISQCLEKEERVPVVTGRPPVRCKRCRAYINPQVQFTQLGRIWVCCYCDMQNEVSTEYFCNLDSNNRRRDAAEKAELSHGSVEYDVDNIEEYALKNEQGQMVPTRPMHHLFLIDVSQAAAPTLPDLVDCMRHSIHQMAVNTPQCKVSFFTYASTLHFYNFKHPSVPQLVVPDVENPFVPLPFTLLCWMSLETEMDNIMAFLDRIEGICAAAEETGRAVGAAVKAASLILAETGGRMILTTHGVPNVGVGIIKPRDQHTIYGTENEKQLFKPIDGFWTSMALELAKKNISVDMLLFATEYSEFVTMGQLTHVTNGSQTLFLNFSGEKDRLQLQDALDHSLLEEAGYAGILRMRCSNGLRVKGYSGHFLSQDPHDMDLATVQGSSTFFVELMHEGTKLDVKGREHIQCAMLYTTRSGSRRVRVHSLSIPVANTYSLLYRNCDLEALLFATMQQIVANAVNKGLKAAHEAVQERILKMLISYRKYCDPSASLGLLLMPEPLRLMPVYINSLLKSDALILGTSIRIDERTRCMHELIGMPLSRLLWYVYPRFYAVHNLLAHANAGTIQPQTGLCHLPTLQQLTADVVMTHGIYLLHDQQAKLVYLWIGSRVAPRVAQALFGVDDATQVSRTVSFDQFHVRLRNLIDAIRTSGTGGMDKLLVVHEGERTEEAFFRNMLEDENEKGATSYPDLLCKFHQKVSQSFT